MRERHCRLRGPPRIALRLSGLRSITDSIFKKPRLRRPYSLSRRRVRLYSAFHFRRPRQKRGRAGRHGSQRTRVASTPHGIKAERPAFTPVRRFNGQPQVRPTHGVPRAVFIGLLRAAPGGLTRFRQPSLSSRIGRPPIHRCGPRSGRQTCDRLPAPPSRGPATCGSARRDGAAWTAGRES
jgi:hypothetical protein